VVVYFAVNMRILVPKNAGFLNASAVVLARSSSPASRLLARVFTPRRPSQVR